jgi:hypothetical protein
MRGSDRPLLRVPSSGRPLREPHRHTRGDDDGFHGKGCAFFLHDLCLFRLSRDGSRLGGYPHPGQGCYQPLRGKGCATRRARGGWRGTEPGLRAEAGTNVHPLIVIITILLSGGRGLEQEPLPCMHSGRFSSASRATIFLQGLPLRLIFLLLLLWD